MPPSTTSPAASEVIARAGTPVEHVDWPGMIHGFFSFAPLLDEGKAAQRHACERLRAVFAGEGAAQVAE